MNSFRFETGWLLDDACEEVVRKAWNETEGEVIEDRLGSVARGLKVWSRERFNNLKKIY